MFSFSPVLRPRALPVAGLVALTVPCLLALQLHGQVPQPTASVQKKVAAKTVALMGTALNFGAVTAGTTSSRQVVVLTNTGTDPVTLSSATTSTNTPGTGTNDFSISSTSCSVPLQLSPKQSCNVYLQFTPSLDGAEIGLLTFTHDAAGSPTTVNLGGLGVASTQTLEIEPGHHVFLPQPVGVPSAAQYFYVYTPGDSPVTVAHTEITGPFQISKDTCSGQTIRPHAGPGVKGGYCHIGVVFLPTATGTATGTLTMIDAATGNPQVHNLMGTALTATGDIEVTPTTITYGEQVRGTTSGSNAINIHNDSSVDVTLNSYTTTGDYSISSNGCGAPPYVLGAGSSCSLNVTFTPTAAGTRAGTLTVGSTAGDQTVTLTGDDEAATYALAVSPPSIDLADAGDDVFAWVYNSGTGAVTFQSEITGADADAFSIRPSQCSTLVPGEFCNQDIAAVQSDEEPASATFTITSSAPTVSVPLSVTPGEHNAPVYVAGTVSFPPTVVGAISYAGYGACGSDGSEPIVCFSFDPDQGTVGQPTISPGSANFSFVPGQDSCGVDYCDVAVQFNPTGSGQLTGTLNFNTSFGTFGEPLAGYAYAVGIPTTTSVVSDINPSVYPQSLIFTATVDSSGSTTPTGSVTFTANGQTIPGCSAVPVILFDTSIWCNVSAPQAGTYSIVATYSGDDNYAGSASSPLTQVVNQAVLTVTANNQSRIYGAANPTLTYTISGFVNGDTQAVVSGAPSLTTTATTTSPAGSYPITITQGSLSASNYTFTFVNGTLSITNPVPVVSGLSPAFTGAGGAAFTLTVTGLGFVSGSTVYWGSSALTTTYGSATQLTAQVPATDIATAGTTTAITVQTPTPGGGTSNAFQFEVNSASGSTTGPTFTSTAETVTAGSTASYPVTLPSSVESATVTCLNLPTGAACSYSSTTNTLTITTSSTTPKGTYQITVVFTETIAGTAAFILLPILLLPLVRLRKKLARRGIWITTCIGLILLASAAFNIGCGGGGSGGGGGGGGGGTQTQQVTASGVVSLTVE